MTQALFHAYAAHACGMLKISATPKGVAGVTLLQVTDAGINHPLAEVWLEPVLRVLDGKSEGLDIPLDIQGTAFQMQVWKALRRIPYGQTASYADVAREIGSAPRAVGSACGANPVLIIVPCHRVIAAHGGLGGFALGLEMKQQLLDWERRAPQAKAA